MSKKISASLVLAASLIASSALAQTPPQFEVRLPPDLQICPTTGCTNKAYEQDIARLKARISVLEGQVKKLTGQVGALGTRADATDRSITEIKGEIAELRLEFERKYELLIRDNVQLETKLGGQILQLQTDLKSLDSRIKALESIKTVSFGPRVGFLALHGSGTTYTSFTFGARLSLRLTELVAIDVDPMAHLANDSTPWGAGIRGGLTFHLGSGFGLHTGLGYDAGGIHASLRSRVAYITGDVGLDYQAGPFVIGAAFLGGSQMDRQGASFAYGGTGHLGLMF